MLAGAELPNSKHLRDPRELARWLLKDEQGHADGETAWSSAERLGSLPRGLRRFMLCAKALRELDHVFV